MTNIVDQAAEWLVKLSDEDPKPTAEDHAGFQRWKNSDPRHSKAVQRMENLLGHLQELPAEPTRAALNNVNQKENESWSSLTKLLTLIVFLLLPLWLILPQHQIAGLLADEHTQIGASKILTLDDNSQITLNSNSAINLKFDQQKRLIELLHGEILINVAHDATRPFVVHTEFGDLTALGTRFIVQKKNNSTILTVLESKVSARATFDKTSTIEMILQAGQSMTLYDDHIGSIETIDLLGFENSWLSHQLVVQDMLLPEVLEELARHYPGHLHYQHDQLADLRVSAVLPLDEPKRALQLLTESFPLQLKQYTPWWVTVERQQVGN